VAVEELQMQILVLDDGFQHRRLARDLDIVLLDATNPFGWGYLLPRGLLREPLKGLRRADLVIVTRSDQVSSVNPKITSTPSTNILWLNRVFRKSTRLYLLIFSIIFGTLAAAGLIYFVNSTGVIQNTAQMLGPRQAGGRRK
jgi:tetraacyldisaccharide 4'-kinase